MAAREGDAHTRPARTPSILGTALNDDWRHTVQCVKTASAISLVVDGQTFSETVTIGSIANTSRLVFGARSARREYFEGALDEASIRIGQRLSR